MNCNNCLLDKGMVIKMIEHKRNYTCPLCGYIKIKYKWEIWN